MELDSCNTWRALLPHVDVETLMTDEEKTPILTTAVSGLSDPADPLRGKVYSVPRRFGMGTIFVVTTLFAVLFGILTSVGAPGEFVLILAGFLAIIGFAQMLLFGGKRPRLASVLPGIVLTTLISLAWIAPNGKHPDTSKDTHPASGPVK